MTTTSNWEEIIHELAFTTLVVLTPPDLRMIALEYLAGVIAAPEASVIN
jgi:hypothetical protein